MYIKDLLKKNTRLISCETFPPKKDAQFESVNQAIIDVAALKPAYISVTYGAGGGTSKNTAKIAENIQKTGVTALAHLTCISSDRDQVRTYIQELKDRRIENILALRGDRTGDGGNANNHYQYAYQLIEEIKANGSFCIAGACYPEGHTESKSIDEDIIYLKQKVETGCDFLISQMFFDNSKMYRFMELIEKHNIKVPVMSGVMPVTDASRIQKMCELSGAFVPDKLQNLLQKHGDKPEEMKKAGIQYAVEQIADLFQNGLEYIHIYTMNKAEIAKSIMDAVRE